MGGPLIDIENIEKMQKECLGIRLERLKVFKEASEHTRRSDVMSALRECFLTKNASHEVYYSGHGMVGTGDWCFEDENGIGLEYITRDDIISLWNECTPPENKVLT